MSVLDAYAVIAFLRAEPAAELVQPVLESGDAVLTAIGVAEVVDHLVRVIGVDEDEAALDLAELGLLDGYPFSAALGLGRRAPPRAALPPDAVLGQLPTASPRKSPIRSRGP